MIPLAEIELTPADVSILMALIYEPEPRIWVDGEWCCPHCLELNIEATTQCACEVAA